MAMALAKWPKKFMTSPLAKSILTTIALMAACSAAGAAYMASMTEPAGIELTPLGPSTSKRVSVSICEACGVSDDPVGAIRMKGQNERLAGAWGQVIDPEVVVDQVLEGADGGDLVGLLDRGQVGGGHCDLLLLVGALPRDRTGHPWVNRWGAVVLSRGTRTRTVEP